MMKIEKIESLHCDAGWRVFSFLKISTSDGIIGYSEYNQSYGSKGVSAVIEQLAPYVIGEKALAHEPIFARLYAVTRQAPNGINAQAIAAIENALLDIKGKALGVPVYDLLGGAMRDRLRLYWSHCGTYRMTAENARHLGVQPLTSLRDVENLGREVADSGLTALKCNIYSFEDGPQLHMPGFYPHTHTEQAPELNADRKIIKALQAQMQALRSGAGEDTDILLDLNFNYKTEGYIRIIRAIESFNLFWCELDIFNPDALASIRQRASMPIASCESLYGLREFRPFFEKQAMDVAIIDVPWNGIWQSWKIAAMADANEVNIAPHNFYGHLCTMMSAHLCAAVPNFRIMEIDIDDVPWKDDLVTHPPRIENGHLVLEDRPGWGTDINEAEVKKHPPKT